MNSEWLHQPCLRCSRPVHYLAHWAARPKNCHRCQLQQLTHLPQLLARFLQHEDKLKNQLKTKADRQLLASRHSLRCRIEEALLHLGKSPGALTEACLNDREMRTVVFQMANDRCPTNTPIRSDSTVLPKRLRGFVQGGAPDLGKRS